MARVDRALGDAREQAVATEEILVALARAGADSGEILDIVDRAGACGCAGPTPGSCTSPRARSSDSPAAPRLVPEAFRRYGRWTTPIRRDRGTLLGRVVADRRTQQIADVLADTEYGRQDLQQLGRLPHPDVARR